MNSFQQKIFNEFVSNNKLSAGEIASLKKYIEMYGFDNGLDRFKRRLETLRAQKAANVSASMKASSQAASQAAAKAASAKATAEKIKALNVSASTKASSQAASRSAAKAASAAAQAEKSLKQVAEKTFDRRAADHEAYLQQAARREVLRNKQKVYDYQAEGQAAEAARKEAAEQRRQEEEEKKALEDLLTATAASEQAVIDDAKASAQAIQETAQETAQAIDGKKAFIIVACIGGAWWLWRQSKKKGARRG